MIARSWKVAPSGGPTCKGTLDQHSCNALRDGKWLTQEPPCRSGQLIQGLHSWRNLIYFLPMMMFIGLEHFIRNMFAILWEILHLFLEDLRSCLNRYSTLNLRLRADSVDCGVIPPPSNAWRPSACLIYIYIYKNKYIYIYISQQKLISVAWRSVIFEILGSWILEKCDDISGHSQSICCGADGSVSGATTSQSPRLGDEQCMLGFACWDSTPNWSRWWSSSVPVCVCVCLCV